MEAHVSRWADEEGLQEVLLSQLVDVGGDVDSGKKDCFVLIMLIFQQSWTIFAEAIDILTSKMPCVGSCDQIFCPFANLPCNM